MVMAWLSPIECAAQTCFQSMLGVCTYENTALLIPQWNELRADINKVCGFVHMKIEQKEEEQSIANKTTGKNRWSRCTGGEVHADPPAWIFPVQACDFNYITLKQIQIIDTLVKLPPLTELSHTSESSTDRSDAHTGLQEPRPPQHGMSNTLSSSSLYHSLRRESVKSTDSGSVTGVKSV